jgi:hypothetical protein
VVEAPRNDKTALTAWILDRLAHEVTAVLSPSGELLGLGLKGLNSLFK